MITRRKVVHRFSTRDLSSLADHGNKVLRDGRAAHSVPENVSSFKQTDITFDICKLTKKLSSKISKEIPRGSNKSQMGLFYSSPPPPPPLPPG